MKVIHLMVKFFMFSLLYLGWIVLGIQTVIPEEEWLPKLVESLYGSMNQLWISGYDPALGINPVIFSVLTSTSALMLTMSVGYIFALSNMNNPFVGLLGNILRDTKTEFDINSSLWSIEVFDSFVKPSKHQNFSPSIEDFVRLRKQIDDLSEATFLHSRKQDDQLSIMREIVDYARPDSNTGEHKYSSKSTRKMLRSLGLGRTASYLFSVIICPGDREYKYAIMPSIVLPILIGGTSSIV